MYNYCEKVSGCRKQHRLSDNSAETATRTGFIFLTNLGAKCIPVKLAGSTNAGELA